MRKKREPSGDFFCVPNSIFKEKLKPKEFIVFCYLKYRSDYDFMCFPSRKLMAKECRMSLPTLDELYSQLSAFLRPSVDAAIENRRRYGDTSVLFGTGWWFSPQLLMYLDERGLGLGKLAPMFTADISSTSLLKEKLLSYYPEYKSVIIEAFARY